MEHSIKIVTTWYLAVIKLNGRIALVKYGRSHPDILCDRKLCPGKNWCQSLCGFACVHGKIRQSRNHCDLGMLELSLLLRNEAGNISSPTSINITALWCCRSWWPYASPDILPKGKLINEPGMESWPGQPVHTQSSLSSLNPWEWHICPPKTGGINTTSAGVQEETRRALQRETACCIWAGYWCLSVTGAARCWFLVHCAEMSRGWEPSTWAMAAAKCQREAHSTKMGELCFSEPLHFRSCLTYFKGESLQLLF